MFELQADKNILKVTATEPLTSGSVNVYHVLFRFSRDWDGLDRYAVFRGNGVSKTMALDGDGICVIPWECLVTPGTPLLCGVYGTVGKTVVLPTIWCSLGMILRGVVEGDPSVPPSPDIWQEKLDGKQDKLVGSPGQVVGFDKKGGAVAQEPGWLTPKEGDERYVRLDPPEPGPGLPKLNQVIKGGINIDHGVFNVDGGSVNVSGLEKEAVYFFAEKAYDNGRYCQATLNPYNLFLLAMDEYGYQGCASMSVQAYTANDGNLCSAVNFLDESTGDGVVLRGIRSPDAGTDAANKKYVDDTVKAAVGDIAAALDAINGEVA